MGQSIVVPDLEFMFIEDNSLPYVVFLDWEHDCLVDWLSFWFTLC
jgi:hypothetical protein